MASWFLKNNFTDEKDRQVARILFMLILAAVVIYLLLIVAGLCSQDWGLVAVTLPGFALLIVPLILLGRRKLSAGSFAFVLFALGTVTAIATVGQGIRDTAIVAFPILFILTGLTLDRRLFRVCVGLALAAICWLAVGDVYGWFVTKSFDGVMQTWILLILSIVLFLSTALAVELLAKNTRKNLARAENEIAQRKQAEEALRVSQQRYLGLVETLYDWVWEVDLNGHYTYISPRVKNILGYEPEDIMGKTLFELMSAEEAQRVAGIFVPLVLQHKAIISLENIIIHKDGHPVVMETNGLPFYDANGNFLGYRGTDRDITERNRLEEALRNAQKLESLGLIAGGIAHNFNNLMGGIFGYIEMASAASKDQKVMRYLTKASNTIDRAKGLTAQFLTFAKGGGPVQTNTPLIPFVRETAQIALSRLNVPCTFDIASDLRPCSIDKTQIGQVLDSIIINAQQAMPNGGSIDLTVINVALEENEHPTLVKDNYVKISIKDHGVGIPKENMSRIFNPFYTTKSMGQGLGLATCYSIINRHGGAIDVESEPGKGSTFHIYLPASAEINSSSNAKSATMNLGTSRTFLIMDDEEVMREATSDMLESLGYSVVSKENGRDTVDFFTVETKANRSFAGLILDLTIPRGMGGKATVAEIRKLNAGTEIPVFVASGYADDPVMKNPTEYGFTASICKPFRRKELSAMLEKYLKRNMI